jgi:hypothetical protein
MIADPTADLLAEHIAEAEDLWQQRVFLLQLPTVRLSDLLACDRRIQAHLDGALVGRELGLEVPSEGFVGDWLRERTWPCLAVAAPGPVWTAYQRQDADRLLALMREPPTARLAGWAFTCLTGQPMSPAQPPADWSEPDAPDPDDGLVWPDAGAAADWWQRVHRLRFTDPQHLLRHGCQPERQIAAEACWPGFPLTAPAWEQLRLLA